MKHPPVLNSRKTPKTIRESIGYLNFLNDFNAYFFLQIFHLIDIPEIFKLISLILTIPATSASVDRSFSVLKRIKSFTRNTIDQSRLNNLGQISIEKELIKSLRKTDTFFDQVIDHFAEAKDTRINLIYKKM
jgi:hypothetical protein